MSKNSRPLAERIAKDLWNGNLLSRSCYWTDAADVIEAVLDEDTARRHKASDEANRRWLKEHWPEMEGDKG